MVRVVLGAVVLALGIGSARVVVSSAEVDEQSAAPTPSVASTVELPENLGSVAGLVAGLDLVEPTNPTTAERRATEMADARTAQAAAAAAGSASTSVPDSTTTSLEDETTTTTAPPETITTAAPVATTTTTAPPETTTTTTAPPETTTTTTPPVETTTTTVATGSYTGVLSEAQALELFSMYFSGSDVDTAMRVAKCESSYNTAAYNPAGYGGLFQHSIDYWPDRAAQAGWAGASIYDGEANTAVTAWLVSANGGWSAWPNC